jgi:hypothetical protein
MSGNLEVTARGYYSKETQAFKEEGGKALSKLLAQSGHLMNDSYYEEPRVASNVPPSW